MEVTFQGKKVNLAGSQAKIGDLLPSFKAVDMDGNVVNSDRFKGKPLLISVVLSIETDV